MFATITINRFVLLIATGSGQGPIYAWGERVFVLKQWRLLVEKAINAHLYIYRDMHHAYM